MGKRAVDEEEFFTLIQQLRSALPKAMKDAAELMKKTETDDVETRSATTTASEIIAQTRDLAPQEQLQIIAALARRLAGE